MQSATCNVRLTIIVQKKGEKFQSKAPTLLEQCPFLSNSKVLVGHSERGREGGRLRQRDDFADGSVNLKGRFFFCEEADFYCTSSLSPANDELNRSSPSNGSIRIITNNVIMFLHLTSLNTYYVHKTDHVSGIWRQGKQTWFSFLNLSVK